MEGALRRSLGSQAQHTHSLEDHTWSIQQSTTTHTKHIHNIQQQNSNNTIYIYMYIYYIVITILSTTFQHVHNVFVTSNCFHQFNFLN